MKKYLIFLGRRGIIYYSWLFTLLCVAFIIAYESNKSVSWLAIAFGLSFVCGMIYTILFSFVKQGKKGLEMQLPFKGKQEIKKGPNFLGGWHCFSLYRVELCNPQKISYLLIERKKR